MGVVVASAPWGGGKRWPGAPGAFVAARAARASPAGGTLPASAGERRQVQELGVGVPFVVGVLIPYLAVKPG